MEDEKDVKDMSQDEYDIYIQGCADTYTVLAEAADKLREGLNQTMDILMNENMPKVNVGDRSALDALSIAYAAISTLESRFQDDYYQALDKNKAARGDY